MIKLIIDSILYPKTGSERVRCELIRAVVSKLIKMYDKCLNACCVEPRIYLHSN